jgi:O-methyltransferase
MATATKSIPFVVHAQPIPAVEPISQTEPALFVSSRKRLSLKRTVAKSVFPRYSRFLDRLNWTARWNQTVETATGEYQFRSRDSMYEYLQERILNSAAIDYVEFGVAEGLSMSRWCQVNAHPESRFFGFDSFEGLPERWTNESGVGKFSTHGAIPQIDDRRLEFLVGLFQKTVPAFVESFHSKNRLVIHHDSDLYSSTLFCLATMDRFVTPGTIVIFDEFYDVLNEYRALVDYTAAFMRRWKIIASTTHYDGVAIEVLQPEAPNVPSW